MTTGPGTPPNEPPQQPANQPPPHQAYQHQPPPQGPNPQGYHQPQQPPGMAEGFYVYALGQDYGPYSWSNLQAMAAAGQLKADQFVRNASGGNYHQAKDVPGVFSDKEWLVTLLLSAFLGHF